MRPLHSRNCVTHTGRGRLDWRSCAARVVRASFLAHAPNPSHRRRGLRSPVDLQRRHGDGVRADGDPEHAGTATQLRRDDRARAGRDPLAGLPERRGDRRRCARSAAERPRLDRRRARRRTARDPGQHRVADRRAGRHRRAVDRLHLPNGAPFRGLHRSAVAPAGPDARRRQRRSRCAARRDADGCAGRSGQALRRVAPCSERCRRRTRCSAQPPCRGTRGAGSTARCRRHARSDIRQPHACRFGQAPGLASGGRIEPRRLAPAARRTALAGCRRTARPVTRIDRRRRGAGRQRRCSEERFHRAAADRARDDGAGRAGRHAGVGQLARTRPDGAARSRTGQPARGLGRDQKGDGRVAVEAARRRGRALRQRARLRAGRHFLLPRPAGRRAALDPAAPAPAGTLVRRCRGTPRPRDTIGRAARSGGPGSDHQAEPRARTRAGSRPHRPRRRLRAVDDPLSRRRHSPPASVAWR